MSPLEFAVACEAWREARADARKRDLALAWHIAVFANEGFAGKLKPLHEVLGVAAPSGAPQSAADMRSVLQGLKGGKAA